MVYLAYFVTLPLLFVLPVHVYCANILSLNDNVSEDFKFIKEKSSYQDMQPIKVFLYIYENIHTGWCMQVVNFSLMLTEDSIDFFMVSCDLKGPFQMENSMITIEKLGYLGVKEHYPIWAVYVMPQGYCVQRRYTDHNWDFLEEIEEIDLNMQQCNRVIRSAKPLRAAVSKVDVTSLAPEKLPKIGESTARIISLDDSFVDEYVRDTSMHNDKEGEGDVAKLTVYHLKHEQTGECARFISINSIYTEDFLDYIVISCDENDDSPVKIAEDMIEYAGLVYVRDHAHEPIWAIFVMKSEECSKTGACEKFCYFKVYTDAEQFKLQPKNQNKLSWSDCLNLMNHKDINGFWSTTGSKPSLLTVKRTYEEVVEMLQVDLAPTSKPSLNPVNLVSEKPEGPGYQAVPQPEPKAPLVIQDVETVTVQESTQINQVSSVLSSPSPASPPPTPTSPSPPATSSSPQEGGIFRRMGFFSGKISGAAENFGLVTKQVTSLVPTNMDEARKKLEEQRLKLSQQFQSKGS